MVENEAFVIPLSLVGRSESISDKTVRRISRRLESEAKLKCSTRQRVAGF